VVLEILWRAAKRSSQAGNDKMARAYDELADRLDACRRRNRCGSLACPKCARAFQRAKVAAQEAVISELAKARRTKTLVMASVIPLSMKFRPGNLAHLDFRKSNRWLKDVLTKAGFSRVMFGSADMSWEEGYYQLHWHIATWTSNSKKLKKRLKAIFPSDEKYDRPVVVSKTWSLGFISYKDKTVKLPDLLRRNRTHLPELLLALDRTEPLELLVLSRLRLSAQDGSLVFRPIASSGRKSRPQMA
jgi:hypothetical protein